MRVTISIAVFFLLLLSDINIGLAQTTSSTEIKVGDKIPNPIMNIVNNHQGKINKPTIINFWATWCVPCIKELKLLDSVLKETDGINVLSVTYEENRKVEAFLERNKELRSGRLTIVSSDPSFHKYFPHRILPHNIWIDTAGIVKYITGSEEISVENMHSFMKNKPIIAKNKEDKISFDPFKPFHLSDSEFIYRSIVTKRIDGIFSGETVHPIGHADKQKILRAFCYNSTLQTMLWLAVNRRKSFGNYFNTMRIETTDSLRFFTPKQAPLTFEQSKYNSRDEWRAENTHCYELTLPKAVDDTLFYSYMLDDLKRNFNIEVKVIEDSILCSIITADKRFISEPKQGDSTFILLNKDGLTVENISVLALFEYLNEHVKERLNDIPEDPPFIDRTGGMRVSVDLKFKEGIPKYKRIKELIEENYGIKIQQQKDKYKITVIKDMG
ncbi:MAG TPA: TlpA disulfide reductase family protein [Sphingobacterium sp.]|nr:TlpA disulfide reductase family protein [Sphingobacterium sp.]